MNNVNFFEGFFSSYDGSRLFHYGCMEEGFDEESLKGIVVFLHGIEHSNPYRAMASYFAKAGYIFFTYDIRDHGRSGYVVGKAAHLDGDFSVHIKDLHALLRFLHAAHPDLPLHVIGYSLGSYILGAYLNSKHALKLETASFVSHIILSVNKYHTIEQSLKLLGTKSKKDKIMKLPFPLSRSLNQKFGTFTDSVTDWLFCSEERAALYQADPLNIETVTNGYVMTVFDGMTKCMKSYPGENNEDVRILLVYGELDPFIGGQKGIDGVCTFYEDAGYKEVALLEYVGRKRDVLKDDCDEMVWGDIINWYEECEEDDMEDPLEA